MATTQQTASDLFLKGFYEHVELLTANFSNYLKMYITIEKKAATEEKDDYSDLQNDPVFNTTLDNLRFYIINTYMKYHSLNSQLPPQKQDPNYKKIHELSKKLEGQYMFNKEDVREYVTLINVFLTSQVMTGLLETNQDIISNLYDVRST